MKKNYTTQKIIIGILCSTLAATSCTAQNWWPQQSNNQNDLNTIFAATNQTVFCYGDSSDALGGFASAMQYKTSNQGFTWNYLPLLGAPTSVYNAFGSHFFDGSTGIIAGKNELSTNGFILRTTNGGVNWTDLGPFADELMDVHFVDNTNGWAVGAGDYALWTGNAGLTWLPRNPSTGEDLLGVFFTTPNKGYVVGTAGVIAVTPNAGNNWLNQTSGTFEDLNAVWFVNDSTGWAVGTAGTIIHTTDTGMTWTAQTSGTPEALWDVAFVNDSTGWIVGDAGVVLNTTDGGQSWIPQTSGTNEDIFSITMLSATLGWYCGSNGAISIYAVTPPNSINENEYALSNLEVYPIPAQDRVRIELTGHEGQWQAELYDATGRLTREQVATNPSVVWERNGLENGLYVLVVRSNSGHIRTQQLIFH